ncbi:MAG: hypothetical protein ACERKS_12935, partial [Candidatus Bathyarchaeota archaeon]
IVSAVLGGYDRAVFAPFVKKGLNVASLELYRHKNRYLVGLQARAFLMVERFYLFRNAPIVGVFHGCHAWVFEVVYSDTHS